MEVEIDLEKSLEENASDYYARSKKAKKKLEGVRKAIKESERKLRKFEEKDFTLQEKAKVVKKRKRRGYEKFHWFKSSGGYLVISGKDAQSNEAVVKKHMLPSDIYFHADIHGAAHTIVKSKNNSAPQQTLKEAAEFAAVFSKAWREKHAAADIYSVKPEQVSKKAPSGEALGTGAFMIYGKRNWYKKTKLNFAVGLTFDDKTPTVISGPLSAVKTNTKNFVEIKQGELSKGQAAKQIKKILEKKSKEEVSLDLDEIISVLPAGGCNSA